MRRRDFIRQSLGAAGALPLAANAFCLAGTDPAPGALLVLVDTRLAASRSYGATAAAQGARISRYNGDLTQLWQQTLLPQWRSGRGAMAGVSTARGWLCLTQLAGEHRWSASAQRMQGSDLVTWKLTPGVRS